MTTFLLVSDLHVSSGVPWEPLGTSDFDAMLQQVSEIVTQVDYNCALLGGDLFNSRKVTCKEVSMLHSFLAVVSKNYTVPLRYIHGNHDPDMSLIADNLRDFQPLSTTPSYINNVPLYGIGWLPDLQEVKHEMQNILNFKQHPGGILLLHQHSSPFAGENLKSLPIDGLDTHDFPSDMLSVIGHIHVNGYVKQASRDIISPGILYPRNRAELQNIVPMLTFVEVSDNLQEYTPFTVPLKRRKSIDLFEEVELPTVLNFLQESLPEHYDAQELLPIVYTPSSILNKISKALKGVALVRPLYTRSTQGMQHSVGGAKNCGMAVEDIIRSTVTHMLQHSPYISEVTSILMSCIDSDDPSDTLETAIMETTKENTK